MSETLPATEKPHFSVPKIAEIELPSRGIFYGGKLPNGSTTITPMTTKDEKILMGANQQDRIGLVNIILERHLDTKGVPMEDLLVGDAFYALLMLRNITFGAEYRIKLKCDECSEPFQKSLYVPRDLTIRALVPGKDKEPFEATLPVCGKRIGLRHQRGSDEKQVRSYVRQSRNAMQDKGEKQSGDPAYTYRMARVITHIDGVPADLLKTIHWLDGEEFHSADSLAMQHAIIENSCGVDLRLMFPCPECGEENRIMFPVTAEFFRPQRLSFDGG